MTKVVTFVVEEADLKILEKVAKEHGRMSRGAAMRFIICDLARMRGYGEDRDVQGKGNHTDEASEVDMREKPHKEGCRMQGNMDIGPIGGWVHCLSSGLGGAGFRHCGFREALERGHGMGGGARFAGCAPLAGGGLSPWGHWYIDTPTPLGGGGSIPDALDIGEGWLHLMKQRRY